MCTYQKLAVPLHPLSEIRFSETLWGPRKFLIFGESENTAKIHMSNFIANRIKP